MWLIKYLAFLIFVSNIVLFFSIFLRKKIIPKISPYALDLSILVALASTLGSLYMSEVAFIPPCNLCWYQRIFMYPLVFILIAAKVRKIQRIWEIVLPLSVVGGGVAAYHYFLQLFPGFATTCGFSTPCTDISIRQFGYVTIPWMSLTAFLYISVFMLILRNKETRRVRK